MPPIKKNDFRQFFNFDVSTSRSYCTLLQKDGTPCKTSYKGDHHGNLERHINRYHEDTYENFVKTHSKAYKTKSIVPYGHYKIIKRQLQITYTTGMIESSVLKKVTMDGRPFVSVEDESYQQIIQPIIKGLGMKKKIDRKYARNLVGETSKILIENLRKEVTGRILCLKLDGGVRWGQKFLGINVQFRDSADCNRYKIFTLACLELENQCTAEYLQEKILRVLDKFQISPNQVYCATTDNGANYVKSIHLLRNADSDTMDEFDLDSTFHDDEFEVAECYEYETDDESYVAKEVKQAIDSMNFFSIKCIEHTFQLSVKDWLKNNGAESSLLQKVRRIVTKARTPNMEMKLKKTFKKKLILDNVTRWSSTFIMVERFLEAKAALIELQDYFDDPLSPKEWESLEELNKILNPCRIATLAFQKEAAIFTELYKYWVQCDLALENLGCFAADQLRNEMEKRESSLFENVCFSSALFLDPRFKILLSPARKTHAIEHLKKLLDKINAMTKPIEQQTINENSGDEILEPRLLNNDHLEVERTSNTITLDERILNKSGILNRSEPKNKMADEFQQFFHNEENMSAESSQDEVLKFWETKKVLYPSLYKLTTVIFSIPGTQVSVERLFSEMKFVLGDLRSALTKECVNEIMLIRRNFDLINFKDI